MPHPRRTASSCGRVGYRAYGSTVFLPPTPDPSEQPSIPIWHCLSSKLKAQSLQLENHAVRRKTHPNRSLPNPPLMRTRNLHILPVLSHRPPSHIDPLRLQLRRQMIVRQWLAGIFIFNQLLHLALQQHQRQVPRPPAHRHPPKRKIAAHTHPAPYGRIYSPPRGSRSKDAPRSPPPLP